MILAYEAIDGNGQQTADVVEAPNPQEAVELLRRRGLFVTHLDKATGRVATKRQAPPPRNGVRLPAKLLVVFTRQLAMLLRAGSGVVPAVSAISRQMRKPAHAAMLRKVVADLEQGSTLTDALSKHPRTFNAVFCAIVAAGEASASLTEMLERLAEIVAKQRALRNKVIGAMAYPALLVTMSTSILMTLLFFVVPRFSNMFTQLHVTPPASTQMLLDAGKTLSQHWLLIASAAAAMLCGGLIVLFSAAGRQWLANVQIQVPIIGRLRAQLIQAQLFRTLGMLLESRVGILDALALIRPATKNRRFQAMFDDMVANVTAGGSLSPAFEASGLVEPYVCQAIHTGEDSGNMGMALTYCGDMLEETNTELVNVVMKMLEPVILICMGVVVGAVAISLFMPLFDLTSAMR